MKFSIPKHLEDKMGIYQITNSLDFRIYVGSAKHFRKRWYGHRDYLKTDRHNRKLQHFVNKYGINTLSFEILELVEDKNQLIEREQHWLDFCKAYEERGFNVLPKAGSVEGFKMSVETRAKRLATLKKNQELRKNGQFILPTKKERVPKSEKPLKRRFLTKEENAEIRRKAYTEEKRLAFSIRNGRPVLQFTLQNEFIREWHGAAYASKQLGLPLVSVWAACQKKSHKYKNYIWRWKDEC